MKNYKFLFDEQSGKYDGITRETPFPENSTFIEPPFSANYITVFDTVGNHWKLVPRFEFYSQMGSIQDLKTMDFAFIECFLKTNMAMQERFSELRFKHVEMQEFIKTQNETYFRAHDRMALERHEQLVNMLDVVRENQRGIGKSILLLAEYVQYWNRFKKFISHKISRLLR